MSGDVSIGTASISGSMAAGRRDRGVEREGTRDMDTTTPAPDDTRVSLPFPDGTRDIAPATALPSPYIFSDASVGSIVELACLEVGGVNDAGWWLAVGCASW